MNSEQKFYKKHPIITAIFLAVFSAGLGGIITFSLNKPNPPITHKEQIINIDNIYISTITITNNGPREVSGLLNIDANKNDSFKSLDVIKGNQYAILSNVQDTSGTINFDLPKGATLEVKTASADVVASHVELDKWYETLKKRLMNLLKSKQSNSKPSK